MGDGPEIAVAAKAQNLFAVAESAAGRIVESVLLEGTRCVEQEAQRREFQLKARKVGDREFEFDLGALHSKSIGGKGRMREEGIPFL